jgi:protoheme ferro-lyase
MQDSQGIHIIILSAKTHESIVQKNSSQSPTQDAVSATHIQWRITIVETWNHEQLLLHACITASREMTQLFILSSLALFDAIPCILSFCTSHLVHL